MFWWKKLSMKKYRPQIDRELKSLFICGFSFEFPSIFVEIIKEWSYISIYNNQDDKLINSDDTIYL